MTMVLFGLLFVVCFGAGFATGWLSRRDDDEIEHMLHDQLGECGWNPR